MLAVSHFSSGLGYRLDHIVRLTRVLLVLVQAVLCGPLGILVSLSILFGPQATSQPTAPSSHWVVSFYPLPVILFHSIFLSASMILSPGGLTPPDRPITRVVNKWP